MPTPPATITLTAASAPGAPSTITLSAASGPGAPGTITRSAASPGSGPETITLTALEEGVVVTGTLSPDMTGTLIMFDPAFNGKPAYSSDGNVDGVPPEEGVWIEVYWNPTSGGTWRLVRYEDGVKDAEEFRSTSDVATPDLATGWTGQSGATGTPNFNLYPAAPSTITRSAASAPGAPSTITRSAASAPAGPGTITLSGSNPTASIVVAGTTNDGGILNGTYLISGETLGGREVYTVGGVNHAANPLIPAFYFNTLAGAWVWWAQNEVSYIADDTEADYPSDVAEEDWLADGSLDPLSGTITITGSYLPPLTITLSAASQPAAPGTIRL